MEQTEPSSDFNWFAGAAGLLRYRREPGHTMNFATLHSRVLTSNLFQIPAYSSIVDQSERLLCPAQVLGRVPGGLRVLRTNCQTFAGAVLGNLARGEINPLHNLQLKASDADVLASVSTLGSDLLLRPEAAAVQAAGSGQIFGWRQICYITGGCDRRSKPV